MFEIISAAPQKVEELADTTKKSLDAINPLNIVSATLGSVKSVINSYYGIPHSFVYINAFILLIPFFLSPLQICKIKWKKQKPKKKR